MIKFRQKEYSILSDTLKGASIGASSGVLATGGLAFKRFKDTEWGKKNSDNPLMTIGAGLIIGAGLGALVGSIKELDKKISRSGANKRIFPGVLDNLKRLGFKEGSDYTQDPKMANILKTKVCIVVSRSSDDLRILINTISDPKLKTISYEILKNLPKSSMSTEKLGDKFNEISISSISAGKEDSGYISGIIEMFIRRGYPTYLIEVG